MRTILVTGAAGFIGRRMTAAAQAAGWHVIGLDRAAPSAADCGTRIADCGLAKEDERRPVLEDGRCTTASESRLLNPDSSETPRSSLPATHSSAWITADLTGSAPIELPAGIDAIIHLAGKAHALAEVAQDEAEYFRINTEGTRRMLEAAQRAGVRAFVLFSTVKAAGDRPFEVASSEERVASSGERIGECGNQESRNVGPSLVDVPPGTEAVRTQGPTLHNPPKPETGNRNSECGNQKGGNGSDIRVHPCSSVVPTPLDESCVALPDTPYGQSKLAAEKLVLQGGYVPHPVAIRPCLVYGPTPKGNLEKMIAAVRCGRFPPLPEVGNKRSMVHIDDVIAAALLAADHPAAQGQVFIAADDAPFSTRQLFEWMCEACGRRVPRWSVPLWVLRLLGRVGDLIGRIRGRRFVFDSDALAKLTGSAWYSSAKLQRELGWKPRHTLRETLPEMMR